MVEAPEMGFFPNCSETHHKNKDDNTPVRLRTCSVRPSVIHKRKQ